MNSIKTPILASYGKQSFVITRKKGAAAATPLKDWCGRAQSGGNRPGPVHLAAGLTGLGICLPAHGHAVREFAAVEVVDPDVGTNRNLSGCARRRPVARRARAAELEGVELGIGGCATLGRTPRSVSRS